VKSSLHDMLTYAIRDSDFWATGPPSRREQSQGLTPLPFPKTTILTTRSMADHLVYACGVRQQYVLAQLLLYLEQDLRTATSGTTTTTTPNDLMVAALPPTQAVVTPFTGTSSTGNITPPLLGLIMAALPAPAPTTPGPSTTEPTSTKDVGMSAMSADAAGPPDGPLDARSSNASSHAA